MSDASKPSTCQIVCWALAAVVGLLVLWSTSGAVSFFAALLLALAFAVFCGLVITRLICTGHSDGGDTATVAEVNDDIAPEKNIGAAPAAPVATATTEVAKPAVSAATAAEGKRPEALSGPRGGKADDLKQIKGVGPKLETLCNELGFYHFDQIAGWGADEVTWVDQNLKGFKGRVSRDNWVEQARVLAAGGETEFSKRVAKGGVYEG